MVTVGSMTANVASYLLALLASRLLGPAGYSEFASLLAAPAGPRGAGPGPADRGRAGGGARRQRRRAARLGTRCAAIVAVIAALLVVPVAAVLDTGVGATGAALLTAPMLVLLATEQGLLQGRGRFGELSVVLAAAGLAKVVPAVVVLAIGGGRAPRWPPRRSGRGGGGRAPGCWSAAGARDRRRAVAERAARGGRGRGGAAGLAGAARADRAVLGGPAADPGGAGRGAGRAVRAGRGGDEGGVLAARRGRGGAVPEDGQPDALGEGGAVRARRAGGARGASRWSGAALVAPLAPLLVGQDYAPVQGLLWSFALDGACLAVLQGALLSAIARERTRLALVAWVGAGGGGRC